MESKMPVVGRNKGIELIFLVVIIAVVFFALLVIQAQEEPISTTVRGMFKYHYYEGNYHYIHKVEDSEYNNSRHLSIYLDGEEYILLGKVPE